MTTRYLNHLTGWHFILKVSKHASVAFSQKFFQNASVHYAWKMSSSKGDNLCFFINGKKVRFTFPRWKSRVKSAPRLINSWRTVSVFAELPSVHKNWQIKYAKSFFVFLIRFGDSSRWPRQVWCFVSEWNIEVDIECCVVCGTLWQKFGNVNTLS